MTMSQEATNELLRNLRETGTLLVDSSSVGEIPPTHGKVLRFPATETAKKMFGNGIYANMIMLGALLRTHGLVSPQSLERAIGESTAKKNVEMNVKAFREGLQLECLP